MRNSMIAVFFALGVALSLGSVSSASAQALDLAECRSDCQAAAFAPSASVLGTIPSFIA